MRTATSRPESSTRRPDAGEAPPMRRMAVPGHPLLSRDPIEARTFARDLIWADWFDISEPQRPTWLASRARSRRDLLWLCRNLLSLKRLSPEIHRPASDFVTSIVTTPRYGFGNLRDPRGNGKTSLATRGGPLWCVVQDPIECQDRGWPILGKESRFGINTLKGEMTAAIMQVILDDLESSDFRAIFPELIPEMPKRWGQKGVDLARGIPRDLSEHPLFATYPRMTRFLDPTFAPGSLESGRAGAHTHGEFIDDPVNEKTWNSVLNIENAIHGIHQLFNIVRPERGFRLVTGNDWCPNDVNDRLDAEGGWRVFMRSSTACETCRNGYPTDEHGLIPKDSLGRPLHKHVGQTFTWLMEESDGTMPDLSRIKEQCGSIHIYMAQYENDPIAPEATLWTADRLPRFEIVSTRGDTMLNLETLIKFPDPRAPLSAPDAERVQVCRVRDLDITLAFDPSHGGRGEGASEAAITVLGRTPCDTFCWLSTIARQDDPLSMLGVLIDEIVKWHVRRIAIESVGFQKIIKPLLLREFSARSISWLDWEHDIVPVSTSRADGDKETRIREILNPLINTEALLISPHAPGFYDSLLQLEGFPVRKPWDTLDSLAMHIHVMRRVPLSIGAKKQIRFRELLKRQERARNMGIAYGWGKSKRPHPPR